MATKVRFIKENLVDENDEVLGVSYEELLESCLKNITKPSISKNIFAGVYQLTGCEVTGKDYRKSNLFNMLEKAVQQNEKYIHIKAETREKEGKANEIKKNQELESRMVAIIPYVEKFRMTEMKSYYRRKKY